MESVTKGIVEVEFMGGLCMNITLHKFELYMQWYLSIARLDMTEDDLCLKFGNWTVIPHGIFYGHPTIKPCRDFTIVRNERGDILVVVWIDGQREPFHISQITGLIAMSMTMDDSVLY